MAITQLDLAARIRSAREACRLTQENVARHLAVSRPTVAQIEAGNRSVSSLELDKLAHLLKRGHLVLMFPEARRSRTGRIDRTHAAHGVGRLVKAVPGTRVLCVYLRGDHQDEYSLLPVKGETFHLGMSWLEPATHSKGLRG